MGKSRSELKKPFMEDLEDYEKDFFLSNLPLIPRKSKKTLERPAQVK